MNDTLYGLILGIIIGVTLGCLIVSGMWATDNYKITKTGRLLQGSNVYDVMLKQ